MKKSSIRDIAEVAGVSPATVSRTLSNPDIVSDRTREKVMNAVRDFDYTPDKLAAGLKMGSSKNIVVMVPDITNQFFNPMVRAIEKEAFARGYSVLIGDTMDQPDHEKKYANLLFSRQADGVITTSSRVPFDIDKLQSKHQSIPPIVSTAEVINDQRIQSCSVNNVAVAQTATDHLISLGHKRIGIVSGPQDLISCQERMVGFQTAMKIAGLSIDENFIEYGDYSTKSGADCTSELLQRKNRPTAILCFGDMVAIGALYKLYEAGFNVPNDISVIGIDGIQMGEYSIPPLTTVAQPIVDIGTQCARMLIDIIEGRRTTITQEVLPHQLILRKSTGVAKP